MAPPGMRPDEDGAFVEFDWDEGPYPSPSAEELAAGLSRLLRPAGSGVEGSPGAIFEAVLAERVRAGSNLGMGPMPTWLELDLVRCLPSHPGVSGMSGWVMTWGEPDDLLRLVSEVRARDHFAELLEAELEDPSEVQQAQREVAAALDRLEAAAAAGDAVLTVTTKSPFV